MICCAEKPEYGPKDDGRDWQDAGIRWNKPDTPCAMEKFFESQRNLPPHLRSSGALLVCFCPKCRPFC